MVNPISVQIVWGHLARCLKRKGRLFERLEEWESMPGSIQGSERGPDFGRVMDDVRLDTSPPVETRSKLKKSSARPSDLRASPSKKERVRCREMILHRIRVYIRIREVFGSVQMPRDFLLKLIIVFFPLCVWGTLRYAFTVLQAAVRLFWKCY